MTGRDRTQKVATRRCHFSDGSRPDPKGRRPVVGMSMTGRDRTQKVATRRWSCKRRVATGPKRSRPVVRCTRRLAHVSSMRGAVVPQTVGRDRSQEVANNFEVGRDRSQKVANNLEVGRDRSQDVARGRKVGRDQPCDLLRPGALRPTSHRMSAVGTC